MPVTSEAVASSLSGRALVLQQGHPLSPLLYPSLLLRSQPYRDVTPASRIAGYECSKVEPGEGTDTAILACMHACPFWILQSLNEFDDAFQEKPLPHIPHQWISLTTPSPFPPM